METITFYSFKGGVGRTLALANVAHYLALLGRSVVAVDFDLEAPGLHYKLKPVLREDEALCGLVDYLSMAVAGSTPTSIRPFLREVPPLPGATGQILLMPAGDSPNPGYWNRLAAISWQDLLYAPESPGSMVFLELKERVRNEVAPDFLLIDARTGITEAGGVATTLLADKVVCLVTENPENLDGARVVLRALAAAPRPPGLTAPEIYPVIARLPARDVSAEREAISRVRAFLNSPAEELGKTLAIDDVLILHDEPELRSRERILIGDNPGRESAPLLQDYLNLFGRISADVIRARTEPIIEAALARLLDAPDEAQRELENLAYSFNLPVAFRQLLKVYRVRNAGGEAVLNAAQRLWQFGDDSDLPLLDTTLSGIFRESPPWRRVPSLSEFQEDVWRRGPSHNPKIAISVAERLGSRDNLDGAIAILSEALTFTPDAVSVLE